jgi:hypothetical protein
MYVYSRGGPHSALALRPLLIYCAWKSLKGSSHPTEPIFTVKSQSYFTTGCFPPISSSWRQAPWDPPLVFFFQLNTCGYSPYVTSSLTKGWVCRLELLLTLTSALILGYNSRGIHDLILLSQIRDSPNLESQVSVFISARNWVTQLYPPHTGFPFRRLRRLARLQWRY